MRLEKYRVGRFGGLQYTPESVAAINRTLAARPDVRTVEDAIEALEKQYGKPVIVKRPKP